MREHTASTDESLPGLYDAEKDPRDGGILSADRGQASEKRSSLWWTGLRDWFRHMRYRFAAVALAVSISQFLPAQLVAAQCDPATLRVVIDVGHTNVSPGARSASGRPEHDFNVALADVVESSLRSAGFASVFRVAPSGPENLAGRARAINALNPDLVLSIHHDSVQPGYLQRTHAEGREQRYSDEFRGWSLFVSMANGRASDSRRLAQDVADQLLATGLPFSRHHAERIPGESRTFIDASRGIYRYDGLAVLKLASAPAVLLEAGIIVNRAEEAALASGARQAATARAAAAGVSRFCSAGTQGIGGKAVH
jgi:N-acetylmuramoyl-L-alanine amidase